MKTVAAAMVGLCALMIVKASGSENSEAVYVAQHGDWTLNRLVDTFDDSELARFAFTDSASSGSDLETPSVRVVCDRNGALNLMARTGGIMSTLGSVWNSDPIEVKFKIDDDEIVETEGQYPSTLTTSRADLHTVVAQMLRGISARIRTQHGEEQHTFRVSLVGFTEALDWVTSGVGKCESPSSM